jgi:hypothetical protein
MGQIDTCNGFYCENFSPNKKYKPKMWTEVWTGWYVTHVCLYNPNFFFTLYCSSILSILPLDIINRYTEFGGAVPTRPAQDLAFSVARFIQNGGSFANYYMVSYYPFISKLILSL